MRCVPWAWCVLVLQTGCFLVGYEERPGMADEMISKETCPNGWRTLTIDLSKFAGQELKLDLVNQANDWAWEFGYWNGAKIISD